MIKFNGHRLRTPLKKIMFGNREIWPGHTLRWFDRTNWWDYCSCNDDYVRANASDIGKVVSFVVHWGSAYLTYQARLIGIDHDTLTDGTGKAHCTFEITTLWCDGGGYSIHQAWSTSDNVTYEGSHLREYCNGTIYNALPEGLRNKIKQVNKIARKSPNETSTLVTLPEYVFSFSAMECNLPSDTPRRPDEGSCYEYYKTSAASKRAKPNFYGWTLDYWLRSSDDPGDYIVYITSSGAIYSTHANSGEIGLSPAFCI